MMSMKIYGIKKSDRNNYHLAKTIYNDYDICDNIYQFDITNNISHDIKSWTRRVKNQDTPPIIIFDLIQERRHNEGKSYLNQDLIRYIADFCYEPKIISASKKSRLILWDIMDLKSQLSKFRIISKSRGHCNFNVTTLSNDLVISTTKSKTLPRTHHNDRPYDIEIRDIYSKEIKKCLIGHTLPLTCTVVINESTIVSASADTTLRLWNITTGELIKTLTGHTDIVSDVVVVNKSILVSGSLDNTVRFWEIETGELINTITIESRVFCITTIDNSTIALGMEDGTIEIWNAKTGESITILIGHTANVNSIDVINKSTIVSASNDTSLRIWDITKGETIRILIGHEYAVNCVKVIDNRTFVSSGDDSTLRIWKKYGDYMRKEAKLMPKIKSRRKKRSFSKKSKRRFKKIKN